MRKLFKRNKKRIISLLLVVTMIGTSLNLDMLAESVNAAEEQGEKNEQTTRDNNGVNTEAEATVVKEIKKERTENSNTYLMSDGSTKVEIYAEDIRYREDGKYKEYDNTLTELNETEKDSLTEIADKSEAINNIVLNDYTYVNKTGDAKQYFASKLDEDTPIVMEKDDHVIGFTPIVEDTGDEQKETESTNKIAKNEESKTTQSEEITLSKVEEDSVKASYEDSKNDVIYNYTSLNNGVKEDIIFNKTPEENEYSFSYTLDKMYMKVDKKTNTVGVYDNKTNKQVALLQTPYLNDSTKSNYSYDIETKISNNKNEWTVTYVLPEEYLKSKETSYPVTLDPTVVWVTENNPNEPIGISYVIELPDAGEYVQYANAVNRFTIGRSGAGDYYKTYIQFKNLNEDLKGKIVSYASMNVNVAQQVGGEMTVDMHEVKEDWSLSNLMWATQPEVSNDVISQAVIGTDESSYGYQVDFTKYCNLVATGKADATKGVELRTEQKSKYMEFWGIKNSGKAPLFIISYSSSPENLNATYDGTFNISGEYDEEKDKIKVSWDEYLDLSAGPGRSYMICKRVDDTFMPIDYTSETSYEVPVDDIDSIADIRVVAKDNKGTNATESDDINVLSNILTFEKSTSNNSKETGATENETIENVTNEETTTIETDETDTNDTNSSVTYDQITKDTDGDGLEDGYEIWDFKTLWNTETVDSTEENRKYELDTDGDGFPDSYEVFTLGTDPAVANRYDEEGTAIDSDNDGWSDYKEYQEGTDPWLRDSDFDGTDDKGDSNPRKTSGHTSQTEAAAANVHVGKYDREYSETEEGVTTTYITNIYNGNIKRIFSDYGDSKLNKEMKYFYDEKGNNTAIIEAYDESYDPKHTKTICITYTYDSNGNVTFICDQNTKYTMNYDTDGNMTNLYVGGNKLINYADRNIVDNSGEGEDTSNLNNGDIITSDEKVTTYGNNQKVKTVTTTYKVADNDIESVASKVETFYNVGSETENSNASYVTEYNSEGNILSLKDYTEDEENPIIYTYAYTNTDTDTSTTVSRSDGFSKIVTTAEDEDKKQTTTSTEYSFKDVKGENKTYKSTIISDTSDDKKIIGAAKLFNNDVFEYEYDTASGESTDNQTSNPSSVTTNNLYSKLYDKYIYKTTQTVNSSTSTSYNVDIYAEDKDIDYTYDLAGNITQIKINGKVAYKYEYDAHGRLTKQKDFTINECHEYIYNTSGNIQADCKYDLDEDGKQIESTEERKLSTYTNTDWPDQLTTYDGQTITYDNVGNPLNYLNGMSFTWDRGRQLQSITLEDDSEVSYKYNQDGLRTYKETSDTKTVYEWDETNLIRETVTYKATNKTYDIWYFYDTTGSVAGFEYSFINDVNNVQKTRVYYEKNIQGDVIGLLDSRGAEIATYSYDAWGNVTSSVCYEGNEVADALNHIGYRGYYQDEETGFYYLQSRYYDASVGRFINADDVSYLGASGTVYGYNLYIYCENNPVMYKDSTGEAIINIILAGIFGVVGWYFGDWIAYKVVGKKNWKYWALRGAVAVGGAAIGWFAGSLIAKYIVTYLRSHPDVIFKLISKLGASRFYQSMVFLGINPFTLSMNSGKFIAIARALNSKSITLGYEWAKQLYYKAIALGFKVKLDMPHNGYTWHIHLSGGNGKLSNLHIQIAKSVWDYLSKIIK